jgi:hypothetical protein
MLADELRQVFVARRNDRRRAGGCGLSRERADDVVGFDAVDSK